MMNIFLFCTTLTCVLSTDWVYKVMVFEWVFLFLKMMLGLKEKDKESNEKLCNLLVFMNLKFELTVCKFLMNIKSSRNGN